MRISEATTAAIKSLSPETLETRGVIRKAKTGYICPDCGNGEGKSGTGIEPAMLGDVWTYHCFKCGASFDNISLLARHYNLDNDRDFNQICQRACDEFGINADFEPNPSVAKNEKSRATSTNEPDPTELERKAKERELIRADILEAQANLRNLPENARRGLSLATLQHFHCGYLPSWTSPKIRAAEGKVPASRRLIIPSSGNHYLASAMDRNAVDKQYHKMHAGSKEIFNSAALAAGGMTVIVEGEMDAMSIWQATGGEVPVVALGGASEDKWIDRLPEKAQFLILFDNDSAGRLNAGNLRDKLIQRGYPAAVAFLSNGNDKIDANDIIRRHGNNALAVKVKELLDFAQGDLEKAVDEIFAMKVEKLSTTSAAAASFLQDLHSSNESDFFTNEFEQNRRRLHQFSNRKTGFENIDAVQTFAPGLYILGGLPGIGKTSFAMQLAEQCAAAGENILFISYEMDVDALRAKTVARELYLHDPSVTLTATDIRYGGYTSSMDDIVARLKKSARNFRIVKTNAAMTDLLSALEVYVSTLDKPPIIFVDYLQRVITSGKKERREGVADNVYALKSFQQRHDATVILLSSLNRDNYSAPIAFESFKETGEIEYCADVIWGLQLYAANGYSGKIIRDRQIGKRALKHQPREMELVCVKNRFGNLYSSFFHYFSAHDHFSPYLDVPENPNHFSSDFDPNDVDGDSGNGKNEGDERDGNDDTDSNGGGVNWETLQNETFYYSSCNEDNVDQSLSGIVDAAADKHFRANHPEYDYDD